MDDGVVVAVTDDLNILVGGEGISEEKFQLITNRVQAFNTDNQELSSPLSEYTLKLRRSEFDNEKELNTFIKSCERLIRMSPEYRVWTDYIREVLGLHSCEITGELHSHTTVDIHHHPISLYSIVKGVILRKVASSIEFCSYDISEEVIQMHYDMRAPFCLLIRSLHDKFHNGFLQLPMELVHGNYKHFIENYITYLDDEEGEIIITRLGINIQNCGWEKGYTWIKSKEELNTQG